MASSNQASNAPDGIVVELHASTVEQQMAELRDEMRALCVRGASEMQEAQAAATASLEARLEKVEEVRVKVVKTWSGREMRTSSDAAAKRVLNGSPLKNLWNDEAYVGSAANRAAGTAHITSL